MRSDYIGGWLTPHTLTVRNLGIKIFSCFVWFDSIILFWKSISHWGFVLNFFFFLYDTSVLFWKSSCPCDNDNREPLPTMRSIWVQPDHCSPPFAAKRTWSSTKTLYCNIQMIRSEINLPEITTIVEDIYVYLNKKGPNQLSRDHPSCRLGYRNLED